MPSKMDTLGLELHVGAFLGQVALHGCATAILVPQHIAELAFFAGAHLLSGHRQHGTD